MNGKRAKQIRRLARTIRPDAEVETAYKTKAHKPRWAMRSELQEVEHADGTKQMVARQVPFRVNTNQLLVDVRSARGVARLLKKNFKIARALSELSA